MVNGLVKHIPFHPQTIEPGIQKRNQRKRWIAKRKKAFYGEVGPAWSFFFLLLRKSPPFFSIISACAPRTECELWFSRQRMRSGSDALQNCVARQNALVLKQSHTDVEKESPKEHNSFKKGK